jgi:protein ImuB
MSRELYACIHAAEFPAQALLRLQPQLRALPVAVLDGHAPLEWVCSMNARARRLGAALPMTRVEAEAIQDLRILHRSMESEAAARAVLLERMASFSPRIEDTSFGTACACVLDITGMERLFGPPDALAQRIRAALIAAGLRAAIAVSGNFHAARIMARASRGITVIADGEEARTLASLRVQALGLSDDYAETFALWGIRTLGELAALPETELVTRLGQEARVWRDMALGVLPHAFRPMEPEFELTEFCEFETPLEQVESLLFAGARMMDCLVERATRRAMALASIAIEMKLEGGQVHRGSLRPALASVDRKFLLKLLQLEIAAHPPPAAVTALILTAEAGQSSKVQLGLFAPQTPEPSRLDVTLARLKAIVGDGRIGSPVLEDTHRPGSFRIEIFTVGGKPDTQQADCPRLALRRMRPPAPVRVALHAMRPVSFRDREHIYDVTAAYGPWRTSGCWWSVEEWTAEEWDVLAVNDKGASVACLLVCDGLRKEWRLEAFYD